MKVFLFLITWIVVFSNGWTAKGDITKMLNDKKLFENISYFKKTILENYKNSPDEVGLTFRKLSAAGCYPNHLDVLSKLENKKSFIYGQSSNGNTALHWAVQKNHLGTVETLITKFNCDVFMKNKNRVGAYELALKLKHMDCIKVMEEHGVHAAQNVMDIETFLKLGINPFQ